MKKIYINGGYSVYEHKDVIFYDGSFGNCQNFTINKFSRLFTSCSHNELLESLKEMAEVLGRYYCVIDIHEEIEEALKKRIETLSDYKKLEFVVSTKYKNRNGSKMCICILNLSKL